MRGAGALGAKIIRALSLPSVPFSSLLVLPPLPSGLFSPTSPCISLLPSIASSLLCLPPFESLDRCQGWNLQGAAPTTHRHDMGCRKEAGGLRKGRRMLMEGEGGEGEGERQGGQLWQQVKGASGNICLPMANRLTYLMNPVDISMTGGRLVWIPCQATTDHYP